jgi:hypothetical protein
MTNNEVLDLIKKATLTTGDNGIQSPEDVEEFVDMMVDQNQLLQNVRVETGITKSLKLTAIDLGEPVITKGTEATAIDDADVTKPTLPEITLTPKESVAAFDLSYSFLRKNIRRESVNTDLNMAYAKRIGKDVSLVVMNGDTANAGSTRKDKALKILDGVITKALADDDVNDHVIPADPTYKGKDGVLSAMINKLPEDFREQRDELIFLVGHDVFDTYADEIGAIETALGSQVLITGKYNDGLPYKGIKILPVYGMPADTVVLTLKQNIAVGMGVEMQVLTQDQHRKRVQEVTIIHEFDANYFLGRAIVLGQKA